VITLAFRALNGESISLVRGTYFRICADGTLRGPDNAVTASYIAGRWRLGRKQHTALECREPVYLRVMTFDGRRECSGPYEGLRVTGGAIFSKDAYLGAHAPVESHSSPAEVWREITLLSDM